MPTLGWRSSRTRAMPILFNAASTQPVIPRGHRCPPYKTLGRVDARHHAAWAQEPTLREPKPRTACQNSIVNAAAFIMADAYDYSSMRRTP